MSLGNHRNKLSGDKAVSLLSPRPSVPASANCAIFQQALPPQRLRVLSFCRERARTGSFQNPLSFCGFSCAFCPLPSSRDPGAQERGQGEALGLPLPRRAGELSPQQVRGKRLSARDSHGPRPPAFLLSRAPPVGDYGYLHWGGRCSLGGGGCRAGHSTGGAGQCGPGQPLPLPYVPSPP